MDPVIPRKRKYELKQRAAEMAETRRRITEAAVELHGSVGPARTTMSAVAARAGVQRHTVYRHFPTEEDLFGACSAHFFSQHPWPDFEAWRSIGDPDRRLALALDEIYAYYEHTEQMFTNVLRDAEVVDALRPTMAPLQGLFAAMTEILAVGWAVRGRRRSILEAALRHALDFHTWRSLTVENGLSRGEAVALIGAFVAAAAPRGRRAARRPAAPLR